MAQHPPDDIEAAFATLLAPVAQLMVQHDLPHGAVADILKRALVAATDTEGASDSAIALRTGVHRKDVKRLRGAPVPQFDRKRLSAASAVLLRWTEDTAFHDKDGGPRPLARKDVRRVPGFDSLVRRTKVDTAPATVLSELLAAGAVGQDDAGIVTHLSDVLVPQDAHDRLAALTATAGAHLAAATANVRAKDAPPFFDRALRFSNLSEASAARLDSVAREGADALLALLSGLAYDLKRNDIFQDSPRAGTFVFGIYSVPNLEAKTKDDNADD